MEVGGVFLCVRHTGFERRGGQLRRAGQEPSADEAQRLFDVKLELADLERQERLIDKDLKWLKQVC